MARVIILKNPSTTNEVTVNGQLFVAEESLDISAEVDMWKQSSEAMEAVSNGTLIVNNGEKDLDPVTGWQWIQGDTNPRSYLGDKLAVHSSAKPTKSGKTFYLVWTGAGDDTTNHLVGQGDPLLFELTTGTPSITKRILFDYTLGDIYLHEAYMSWSGGGLHDYVEAIITALPTSLQQSVDLHYVIENNRVKMAPGGPGTGTHGFASNPILIPRSFTKDGDWDYNETTGLVPNTSGTGEYIISDIEQPVHKYINHIHTYGSSNGYVQLASEETAYLPPGYVIDITAYNNSNSDWVMMAFMELYREKTV